MLVGFWYHYVPSYVKGLVKKHLLGAVGRGGSEQRGGGSSVFEPLVRGGSFTF